MSFAKAQVTELDLDFDILFGFWPRDTTNFFIIEAQKDTNGVTSGYDYNRS